MTGPSYQEGNRTQATGRTGMENHYKGFLRIFIRKVTSSHILRCSLGTQMKEKRQNPEPSEEATVLT